MFLKLQSNAVPLALRKIIMIIIVLLVIIPIGLFISFGLETQVKIDGVYVRFLPFRPNFTAYNWNTLAQCYIRQYDPIAEYGGWGFRNGPSGKALNVSGDYGLQLKLRDGSSMLIGTNSPDELNAVLKSLGQVHK